MSAPRVLLTQALEAGALEQISASTDLVLREHLSKTELLQLLPEYDAAIIMLNHSLESQDFNALQGSRLKIIANHAVGYDNIDLFAASEAGIWISNTPDVLTLATAEMAWALLFALSRRLIEGHQLVASGAWQGWQPTQLLGQSLYGKTLGIVGAGRIGQAMAKMGAGFGLNLLYFNRSPRPEFEEAVSAWASIKQVSLSHLFEHSDLISLHLPGGSDSHHLINEDLFSLCKSQALLVNTGRGTCLDEQALINALHNKLLAGAALDVYEFEPHVPEALRVLDNVVLAPHLGSATVAARRAMALCCLDNIQAVFAGKHPPQAINTIKK